MRAIGGDAMRVAVGLLFVFALAACGSSVGRDDAAGAGDEPLATVEPLWTDEPLSTFEPFVTPEDGSDDTVPTEEPAAPTSNGYDALRYLGGDAAQIPCYSKSGGDGISCASWSASVSFDLKVTAISLFAEGVDGFAKYTGELPLGLAWGMAMESVTAQLGEPVRQYDSFGDTVLVYSVSGEQYSSLEVYFGPDSGLKRITVSL